MRILAASALVFFGIACTTSTTSTNNANNASGTDGGTDTGTGTGTTPAPGTGGINCLAILDCASSCEAAGCEDACVARGSKEGQDAANALAKCFVDNACEDAECIKTKCPTELEACTSQPAQAGKPVDSVPTGSAPSELVGKWHFFYAPTANVDDFTFASDGTAKRYIELAYKGIGSCTNTLLSDGTGTVVVSGSTLTYYETSGTVVTNSCGNEQTRNVDQKAYQFSWSIDGSGNLVLVDQNTQFCAENPNDPVCTKTYEKL